MLTEPTSERTRSPVRGVIPEPIRPRNPASRMLAKLVSTLRGDKYMVGAYPPEWRGASPARDAPADDAEPSTTAGTAPAVSDMEGR